MRGVLATDLAPQRPRYVHDRGEVERHILEPEWSGTRALVRVGHPAPHFVGYSGPVEAPRELYDAIVADARCSTAVIDGVVVSGFAEEAELDLDAEGNAIARGGQARTIFAAFDLLEVDSQLLVDVPLLERKRHLEAVLPPSRNVRLTAFRARDLRAWNETLREQGFRRVVLKDWNSPYSAGETNDSWLVIDKIRDTGRR